MSKKRTFEEQIAKAGPDDCWLWTGAVNGGGYGSYGSRLAHRVAWEKANGPIPAGKQVLHRCDTPPCVNDAHLFLGTRSDNMQDCSRKRRLYSHFRNHPEVGAATRLTGENSREHQSKAGLARAKTFTAEHQRKAALARWAKRGQ